MKTKLSKPSLLVFLTLTLTLASCGVLAPEPTPTATATNTVIPTPTPTITTTPTKTPTPTATPNLTATQQYNDFFSLVQKYYDEGQISTKEGKYVSLDSFSDVYATDFGYRWRQTGAKAKDFIIRSDFEWSTAIRKNYSGCGYVFRQKSDDYYYMIALDAVNGVLLSYLKDGTDSFGGIAPMNYSSGAIKRTKLPDMGSNPYHAAFTLIINGDSAYTYINDVFNSEHELRKNWLTESGPLSYMILAGSSADYGTRCKITNTEMWIISP